jgi:ATP-dependent exoDNAse (exonuclease V) beta subunit
MKGGDGREEVRRTFYVGMTRAREDLIICQPSSNMSVAF